MIIRKTKIKNLETQFKYLKEGTKILISVANIDRFDNLIKIGFTEKLDIDEQVLPAIG